MDSLILRSTVAKDCLREMTSTLCFLRRLKLDCISTTSLNQENDIRRGKILTMTPKLHVTCQLLHDLYAKQTKLSNKANKRKLPTFHYQEITVHASASPKTLASLLQKKNHPCSATNNQPMNENGTSRGPVKCQRVLLKESGEALAGDREQNINPKDTMAIAREVTDVTRLGVERNMFPGALLHDPIAQVMRERPLSVV
ncbi:hypothetical protein Tco_0710852 [Tanacetum coccineum]